MYTLVTKYVIGHFFQSKAYTINGQSSNTFKNWRNDFRTGPYFIMHAEAVMHVQIFLVFDEQNIIVTECIMK